MNRRSFLIGALAAPTIIGIDNRIQFGRLLVPPPLAIKPEWDFYRVEVIQPLSRPPSWHTITGNYPDVLAALARGEQKRDGRPGKILVYRRGQDGWQRVAATHRVVLA